MIGEELFDVETQLVLPKGELLRASVKPNWTVEIGGSLSGIYSPEQAICFLALARNIDKPLLIQELLEQIVDVNTIAQRLGAKRNPLIGSSISSEEVINTTGSLINKPESESDFRYNTLLLGHGEELRVMLLGNVADIGFGLLKIEDFFTLNPGLADLQIIYKGFFERAFNAMHAVETT